jgi:7-cyano-7-deazaguanine synthase in queuosine biosynthesis
MSSIKSNEIDTFLSYSGGMDSVLVLYKLLKQGNNVLVHHVRYKNAQGRSDKEYQAVKNTLEWMDKKHLRGKYRYLESSLDVTQHQQFVRDSVVWSWFTGCILSLPRYSHIKRVATGRHANSYSGFRDPQKAMENTRMAYQDVMPVLAGRSLDLVHPIGDMTKLEIVQALPDSLRELCWSCRRPTAQGKRCHRCLTCKHIDMALRGEEVPPEDWQHHYG